ncbi:sterol O-acyltransferase 1-like [Armigeres subalbatus]|uniref:sterol O-acyltransferase 1-like n=1 Tax=Armigeres subalbatus TaxID=124917 RepID=UPI002ED4854B
MEEDITTNKRPNKMDEAIRMPEQDVDHTLEHLLGDIIHEAELLKLKNHELRQLLRQTEALSLLRAELSVASCFNNRNRRQNEWPPDKEFVTRNSLLTDLFEVKHIKTIYYIFVITLIVLFLNTVVYDFIDRGVINFGFRPIVFVFRKFHLSLALWACMQLVVLCVYPAFKLWSKVRNIFADNHIRKVCDLSALIGLIVFQCSFIYLVIEAVLQLDIAPVSSLAALLEMTRFVMKVHSFVRTNVPRVLDSTENVTQTNKHTQTVSSFTKYLYFLFAPTLIYRDEYPRTQRIRWTIVLRHALEVIGVICYMSFIFERFLTPLFDRFGDTEISSAKFVLILFESVMPATLIFLCGFFLLLHSWLNGSSELLRFADRMFYGNWWNASSFVEFFRLWNVAVSDWLYAFLYKESIQLLFKNHRLLATILVFTVSAIFHEVIMAFSYRFFYPVMFVGYEFVGLSLLFLTRNINKTAGSILLWFLLSIGNGIQMSLYHMEYYARKNCPLSSNDSLLVDYFIPVSWSCNGITNNSNWTFRGVEY